MDEHQKKQILEALELLDTTNLALLLSFSTLKSSSVSLTTGSTAYLLPTTEQTGRRILAILNTAGEDIYIGGSDVSTTNGFTIFDDKYFIIGASEGVYCVCSSSSKTVRVLEAK